jgi:VIT1/CCC1 family predicted Fe2+/Mn2+ transporter
MLQRKKERHNIDKLGWLRAAVLGANDGIVSTSSLVLGIAATDAGHAAVLLSAVAGLVSGSLSMATGEYVSVSSQSDTEAAALDQERRELKLDDSGEHKELAAIYVERGVEPGLARKVAAQLMAHDALEAHARDELNLSEATKARPLQAAVASASSFACGAALPLAVVAFVPHRWVVGAAAVAALGALALLGMLAARSGGAPVRASVVRVVAWSALAMAVTFGVGRLFGAVAG